jgi:hypothetical protein
VANSLSPVLKQKFFTNNGAPAAGYKVFTYEAGTDTKLDTYQGVNGATNANPIILDFRGEANIWLPPNVAYKFVYSPPNDTDPPTNPIWTVDQVVDSQLITLYGGVDTGIANAYVLNFTANFTAYTDGILIYFLAANQNTGASTLNVNGLGPIPILTQTGLPLPAGFIVANQLVGVMYQGGNFYLVTTTVLSGSFQATLSGMTALTQGTINYLISGGVCTLSLSAQIVGTSNDDSMVISGLPAAVTPATNRQIICSELIDDGDIRIGSCAVNTLTNNISVGLLDVIGAKVGLDFSSFVTSGLKGLNDRWSITYPL